MLVKNQVADNRGFTEFLFENTELQTFGKYYIKIIVVLPSYHSRLSVTQLSAHTQKSWENDVRKAKKYRNYRSYTELSYITQNYFQFLCTKRQI